MHPPLTLIDYQVAILREVANFSLSAAPQAVHLFFSGGHCSGSTTITVNPLFGFTAPVQLSAAGPGLASAQFSPVTTTGTSQLTMRATFCRATGDQDTFVDVTGIIIYFTIASYFLL